ncbi:MAG: glutamine--tRNA ligase/YqeY domain fusion protein [Magnetococcales bacterium]|nr:glutamine--tRNA ligase/YqeY domain fusion protein [Magnetococcales bacterium]
MASNEELDTRDLDFIRAIIAQDLASGKHQRVVSRFPPEPNGFLHIGHAKSICLNFGVAEENPNSLCRLRFDDTNPEKESQTYIDAIETDVRWLGFDWGGKTLYTSDYFDKIHASAVTLIQKGQAYVCDLSAEETRNYRGTLTDPGRESPFRNRSIEENLDLFERMGKGEFDDGACVLRAKIDMASPNMNLRDPTLYRIRRVNHHQTGDSWCIYPTYDFSHPISDWLEGVTHSLCTLEFEDHRPLYDWVLAKLELENRPRQIEFSRLDLEYTVMSKRKLNELVTSGHVNGWDDPRMPTLSGLRRRGFTPKSIRTFCGRIGISKAIGTVELAQLEACIREDLEEKAPRAMAVLDPIKVVIDNFPEGQVEEIIAPNHPQKPERGERTLYFTREIWIDREDFKEIPPRKYKRLIPGGEVRLRNGYVIRCDEMVKDPESGEVVELSCSYDPKTLGAPPEGRKVKGVIHWVSAERCVRADIRLYDHLFTEPNPDGGGDFTDRLNPDSLTLLENRPVEMSLANAQPETGYQFERVGYFSVDEKDSTPERLVFNRTVSLRDSWAKIVRKG